MPTGRDHPRSFELERAITGRPHAAARRPKLGKAWHVTWADGSEAAGVLRRAHR